MKKTVFLVWASYHRRSELLAEHFGAKIFYITYGKRGNVIDTIAKYPLQALFTWRILSVEKPDLIFVQNPPIFCAMVAYLFGLCYGSKYIIDSHTGAFLTPLWRKFLWLNRWLSRRALMTIVHNKSQEITISNWKCPYCVIGFIPGKYPEGEQFLFDGKFNVAVISTYGDDEPLVKIFEAADYLSDVDFYITGTPKKNLRSILTQKPDNCHLTGYLTYDKYIGLLRGADVVMDLTTRDQTLLMGGFEAVSLGKPLIVSEWPVLKDYFFAGTVFVPNTVQGISKGVRQAQHDLLAMERDVEYLRDLLQQEWEKQFKGLKNYFQDQLII